MQNFDKIIEKYIEVNKLYNDFKLVNNNYNKVLYEEKNSKSNALLDEEINTSYNIIAMIQLISPCFILVLSILCIILLICNIPHIAIKFVVAYLLIELVSKKYIKSLTKKIEINETEKLGNHLLDSKEKKLYSELDQVREKYFLLKEELEELKKSLTKEEYQEYLSTIDEYNKLIKYQNNEEFISLLDNTQNLSKKLK